MTLGSSSSRPRALAPRSLGLLSLAPWLVLSCSEPRPAIRNVLLISIDTLRADHLSGYGFPRPTTPNIDAVAREGVLFKNVYTPVPMTLPAHASMLTGTLPPTHGLRDNLQKRLPEASLTLAEMLKAREASPPAAIVSSFVLDRRFGTEPGLRQLRRPLPGRAQDRRPQRAQGRRDDRALAREWLDAHTEPAVLPLRPLLRPARSLRAARALRLAVEGRPLRGRGGLRRPLRGPGPREAASSSALRTRR